MITKAFILGAGLGNRLRPLTSRLPKPLVPLFHRPLAEWAMEACKNAGIEEFAINTHHLPEAWESFGNPVIHQPPPIMGASGVKAHHRTWEGCPVALFHEPILLETGGGLKNIEAWQDGDSLLVHNGDIFTTLPLEKLIAAHRASGLPATLALRSHGAEKRIAINAAGDRVIDVRHELGVAAGTHVFSGVYCVSGGFADLIPNGIISVIPAFLDLASRGLLGAVVLDDGRWLDLGDRTSYLKAHSELGLDHPIHPTAQIAPGAVITNSVIGPGAVIGSHAVVRDSVVWPGGVVADDASLEGCIVYSTDPVSGSHRDTDL